MQMQHYQKKVRKQKKYIDIYRETLDMEKVYNFLRGRMRKSTYGSVL